MTEVHAYTSFTVGGQSGTGTSAPCSNQTFGTWDESKSLSCVKQIQIDLNAILGLTLTVDGYYGPETEGGVQVFQRQAGITVDGIVGPQTWSALDSIQYV